MWIYISETTPYLFIVIAIIGLVIATTTLSEAHRAVRIFGPARLANGRRLIVAIQLRRRAILSVVAYIVFMIVGLVDTLDGPAVMNFTAVVVRLALTSLILLVFLNDILDRRDRWRIRSNTHTHSYSHTHEKEA